MVDLVNFTDEIGPGVVILIGAVLVIFPEPATSALGAGLVLFGLAWLAWEWNRP
jgi:hypothetical protein